MYYIKLYYVNNYSFLNQTLFVAGIVSMTNILGVAAIVDEFQTFLLTIDVSITKFFLI